MSKVWSNRFDSTLNPFIEQFNASIGFVPASAGFIVACPILLKLGTPNFLASTVFKASENSISRESYIVKI